MATRITNEIVSAMLSVDPEDFGNDVLFLFEIDLSDDEINELQDLVADANAYGRAEARADYLGIAVH